MSKAIARIDGLDELRRALKATPKAARRRLRDMLETSAEAVAASSRENVRRREGDLYRAITVGGRGLTWRAGIEKGPVGSRTGARSHTDPSVYGQFVEYGTSRTQARPFMKPAAEGESNRIESRLRALASALEGDARSA
jgi:HK97 gp10 family phage protein